MPARDTITYVKLVASLEEGLRNGHSKPPGPNHGLQATPLNISQTSQHLIPTKNKREIEMEIEREGESWAAGVTSIAFARWTNGNAPRKRIPLFLFRHI